MFVTNLVQIYKVYSVQSVCIWPSGKPCRLAAEPGVMEGLRLKGLHTMGVRAGGAEKS